MSLTSPLLPGLMSHPSGALWLPEVQTVLIADLHLGYSWAQRRRGDLGPLADFQARRKLLGLCDELNPKQIVFLGDLVHAPRPCAPERSYIEETLNMLIDRARVTAVRGNHDRAFAREFGHLAVTTGESWSCGSIVAVHGDRLDRSPVAENGTLIVGHLHPCLSVREASGAGQKIPLFLANRHCVVLPAFSPFARGYDVAAGLPAALRARFQQSPIDAYAATPTRIKHLGLLSKAIERLAQADAISPSRFRRFRSG